MNYKCRNNNEVKRDDVIHLLASMVTKNGDYSHTVDLSNPELTVVVEIVKVKGVGVDSCDPSDILGRLVIQSVL